jgi:hypothetical protein
LFPSICSSKFMFFVFKKIFASTFSNLFKLLLKSFSNCVRHFYVFTFFATKISTFAWVLQFPK